MTHDFVCIGSFCDIRFRLDSSTRFSLHRSILWFRKIDFQNIFWRICLQTFSLTLWYQRICVRITLSQKIGNSVSVGLWARGSSSSSENPGGSTLWASKCLFFERRLRRGENLREAAGGPALWPQTQGGSGNTGPDPRFWPKIRRFALRFRNSQNTCFFSRPRLVLAPNPLKNNHFWAKIPDFEKSEIS